jgi:predicted RNA-binding Zn-ribbon protein involved in translation (DUF1610 family)
MVTGAIGARITPAQVSIAICGVSGSVMRRITDHLPAPRLDIALMAEPAPDEALHATLHLCPDCGSDLVQPTSWEQEADRTHWRVWRRCPECEWTGASVHDEIEVDVFDEQLDLGARELANELRVLEHANMSEMVAAFITALGNDLISADDFSR